MDFNEYQKEAIVTKSHWGEKNAELAYCAMGLAGESGEVVEIIKKHFRGDKPLDNENKLKLQKELGDVLWYIASTCDALGFKMNDVAQLNIEKLRARHGNAFSGFGDRSGAGN